MIGAVIIKHKLCLSDEETVLQIQESFYLQYFVGFPAYQDKQPFAPSLFVEIRRRMDEKTFVHFQQAIVNAMEKRASTVLGKDQARHDHKDDEPPCQGRTASAGDEGMVVQEDAPSVDEEAPIHQGKLILDATVAEQAIRFPTDLSLLNEGREISEQIGT